MKQYLWLPTLLSILVVAAFGIFLVPEDENNPMEQYNKVV